MPMQLAPIALAALVPLLFMVLFLGVRIFLTRRAEHRRRAAPPPAARASGPATDRAPFAITPLPPVATTDPWPGSSMAGSPPALEAAQIVDAAPAVAPVPRKVDHQLASRYARPATAAWKAWCSSWLDAAPPAPVEPGWIEAVVDSFLALARPIVIEMEPSPDSADPDMAASAVRAIYLHPERYVMIQGRWHVLEAVAPKTGGAAHTSSQRWQMGPAGSADPGGHTLVTPMPRSPRVRPFTDASGSEVVQALTIEGLVETTGARPPAAARMTLEWSGLEEIADDLVAIAVSDAARIGRALGVTD